MKVIKRSGREVEFEINKIIKAISKANKATEEEFQISEEKINQIAYDITTRVSKQKRALTVEEIQNFVENELMRKNAFEVARTYITYRYEKALARKQTKTDSQILSLVEYQNEEVKQENSNKNPAIISTQRDYIAGTVSKDLVNRFLLPKDIVEAHEAGIIHFHDADYFIQHSHNCDLLNLEDMLQNGTVISGTLIEKPHSFSTACNIATQIVAQVASSQYGGQTFTLTHLAPFVDISRKKIRKEVEDELNKFGDGIEYIDVDGITEKRVKDEIKRGVQTIQYQINTLMTTNGQTPFVSINMYLNEAKDQRTKDDLALIIEEVLKQRIQGTKNRKGIWVTPAFPKLLYVLEEDNIKEGTKYFYLTKLAAECTAKRMVPDYISEKKMIEYKGDVYPCMGCVEGNEVVTYKFNEETYTESIQRMWDRLSKYFKIEYQPNGKDYLIKTPNVMIYDQKKGFVNNFGIIKNHSSEWLKITFSNGRVLTCTPDHPFETNDNRVVLAKDLTKNDIIEIDHNSDFALVSKASVKPDLAWFYGVALCDSTYYDHVSISIAAKGEDEIEKHVARIINNEYGLLVKPELRIRGMHGLYKDLLIINKGAKNDTLLALKTDLISKFGGKAKLNRHIPNDVFTWNNDSKLSFLAGMIDADGYLNTNTTLAKIQIGSTNKELAVQQALLAQSCGMAASIYQKHYSKNKIKYRVEFVPTEELLNRVQCMKKKDLGNSSICKENNSISMTDFCTISSVESFTKNDYSYDVTTNSEHFTVSGIYSHNCRSFLTPDRFTDAGVGNIANAKNYVPGEHKYYGRFNQGVVTINLVDIACSSKGDEDKFWEIFDERMELCHRALRCRHERLLGTTSDVAPILWQNGALARLDKGEKIDKLLYNGYSTISLGFCGLWEMTKYMKNVDLTDPVGEEFGLRVMEKLNEYTKKWKLAENIDYSVYGTPLESTTYKFAKCLQNRFGIIPGVTDKKYITNSYHIHVTKEIDAFSKLAFEAKFQKLAPGGAISYVEVPDMQNNIDAVITVIQFIYDNIMYAELNTKSDYCECCGYNGEIQIVEEDDKLIWKCPNCGNTDQNKMSVARRTCGYIGTQFWNQGRTQEIKERVLHL